MNTGLKSPLSVQKLMSCCENLIGKNVEGGGWACKISEGGKDSTRVIHVIFCVKDVRCLVSRS